MQDITFSDIENLSEAYGASTPARNMFIDVFMLTAELRGAEVFTADGEFYAVFGNAIVTTQSLVPFECDRPPEVMFTDGTGATFELGTLERVA